jgi:hypothetical protein
MNKENNIMTRRQYVINTNKLTKEIDATYHELEEMRPLMPKERFKVFEAFMLKSIENMNIHLGDLYQRAVNEPWWPEYLKAAEAQRLKAARRNGCIK